VPSRESLDAARARRVAFDLLSRKPWSRRDLTARLRRRGAPPEVAQAVVRELEGKGYVDDRAFARQWADARAARRGLGSLRLRDELRRKGVAPALAEAAVREAFAETAEEEQALGAARRRLPALRRAGDARAPARLRDFLLRRGYPAPTVGRVVRRLLGAGLDEDA
jgi:regulatory protein